MLVKALAVVTLDIEVGCRCEAVLAGSLDEEDREALEAIDRANDVPIVDVVGQDDVYFAEFFEGAWSGVDCAAVSGGSLRGLGLVVRRVALRCVVVVRPAAVSSAPVVARVGWD